ncbi:PP2C family protein-serine/threonine phosphatase [Actinokineospora sp. NBRC 105648]|uniref:PP2C family protein-serine/threonine phosphatase n=1 Tax=Actinokineospora sp. NBRC 105648 TaxID=3032206 RepID=UPI0024A3D6C0|nr:PP2C family protein-serine/threonine phosphatase [Actinokineospora sp. NBRC 105648]GLZ36704.1 hypothetical protein Acsp05_03290 [Actinokineospora sp. NBRC 105648]
MTSSRQASQVNHPERTDAARPLSADAAIELLLTAASCDRLSPPRSTVAAHRAAAVVRGAIRDLESLQAALTEALVASQDRLLAMKTIAKVDFQGVASDEAIGLLLGRALALTDASAVLLLQADTVVDAAGDASAVEVCAEVARQAIAQGPGELLRTVAGDSAIVGSLDVDITTGWHVAYFRPTDRPFVTTDIPLVEAINSALGVLLAFNETHRREQVAATVAREHELASVLAQSVITDAPPTSATLDIFARTEPASLAGGDFYVFGQTNEAIWFAVGDVAGKGLPAAILMTRAVTTCRATFLSHRGRSVIDAYAQLEDELFDHLDDAGLFVTLVMGFVCEGSGTVSLVNAGHSPVVHVHDGIASAVPASLPPTGIVRHRVPALSTFTLRGDDCLVMGSDGLVEQADPAEAMFGYDRFDALCQRTHALPASRIGDSVFDAVAEFAAGTPASDDSTLVVVKHRGTAS